MRTYQNRLFPIQVVQCFASGRGVLINLETGARESVTLRVNGAAFDRHWAERPSLSAAKARVAFERAQNAENQARTCAVLVLASKSPTPIEKDRQVS